MLQNKLERMSRLLEDQSYSAAIQFLQLARNFQASTQLKTCGGNQSSHLTSSTNNTREFVEDYSKDVFQPVLNDVNDQTILRLQNNLNQCINF